jgi:flagellar protein FlbT
LSGNSTPEEAKLQLLRRIEELSQALTDPDSRTHLTRATEALLGDQHYQCLKALRALLPREDRLLAHRMS